MQWVIALHFQYTLDWKKEVLKKRCNPLYLFFLVKQGTLVLPKNLYDKCL